MKNIKKIFTYVVVGALVSALFISCGKNPAEPGTEGNNKGNNGNNSVPTSTDAPATDLPNGYYKGNLQCKSCIVSYSDDDDSYESLKQYYEEIFTRDLFYLKIDNNKLKWTRKGYEDFIEDMAEEVVALKSGSEYSVTYSSEDNTTTYIYKIKETIRFTISGDTISITTYILEKDSLYSTDRTLQDSLVATYEGTLTKYAETETTETIESKDFPTDTELSELFGTYRDNASKTSAHDTKVSYDASSKKIKIEGHWFKDGDTDVIKQSFYIEKWTKTTKKYGKIIKLEGEMEDLSRGKAIVTYDYETKTLIGKFDWCYYDGKPKYSFNGKKI